MEIELAGARSGLRLKLTGNGQSEKHDSELTHVALPWKNLIMFQTAPLLARLQFRVGFGFGSGLFSFAFKAKLLPLHSDGNHVLTGAKPARAPLQVLLVGNHEEDFFLIRDMLERNRSLIAVELEHARSLDEARELLHRRPYSLVLFEHEAGDAEAVHLVTDLLHNGHPVPFILLTEDADEKTVAEIIGSGTWNCLARSRLDGATLLRTIHNRLPCIAFSWSNKPQKSHSEVIAGRRTICRHGHDHGPAGRHRICESRLRSADRL